MQRIFLLKAFLVFIVLSLVGCTPKLPMLNIKDQSIAKMSGSRSKSMVFAAKTTDGVVLIDLGWLDGKKKVRQALENLSATEEDVKAVFITHSHRDHISGWPVAKAGTFYMGKEEIPRMLGTEEHRGWIPNWAEFFNKTDFPKPNELDIVGFQNDTTIVVGQDTVHAFKVVGHTSGSSAYLFRKVLFAGDAVAHPFWGRYRSAMWGFSDDTSVARESLSELFVKLRDYDVDYVCTAHAKCGEFDDRLIKEASPSSIRTETRKMKEDP